MTIHPRVLFAFRNIFRHRARTLLTISAIILGVVGIVLSGGFIQDIYIQLREATIHSQLGHVQLYEAGYYAQGRRDPYSFLIDHPEEISWPDEVGSHVEDVLMRLNFSGLISTGRAELPIIGEGVEPNKEAQLGTFVIITAGRQLEERDAYGILIGQGIAKALKLSPGEFVSVLLNTPDGSLNSLEFEVVGVFRSFSRDYDDRAIRISLSAAQELLVTDGVHSLVFSLRETDATNIVADQLRKALSGDQFEVKTWYELAGFYRKTVDLYGRQFGVLQLIILVMVLLSVANSVNMSIYERTGEFGTLLALGNRRADLFWLVILEHVLLGLLGGGLGVALGVLLAWGISSIGIPMPPPPNSNTGYVAYIRIVPWILVAAFLIGVVATILAAVLPARRAKQIPIVEALRHNL